MNPPITNAEATRPAMKQPGDKAAARAGLLLSLVGLACGCESCPSRCGVPDRYPLGSVNRAHYQTMEANAEAADFILHHNEFVGDTAELTPYGKDHILEIAAQPAAPRSRSSSNAPRTTRRPQSTTAGERPFRNFLSHTA